MRPEARFDLRLLDFVLDDGIKTIKIHFETFLIPGALYFFVGCIVITLLLEQL